MRAAITLRKYVHAHVDLTYFITKAVERGWLRAINPNIFTDRPSFKIDRSIRVKSWYVWVTNTKHTRSPALFPNMHIVHK